jgi:hypothetical protein
MCPRIRPSPPTSWSCDARPNRKSRSQRSPSARAEQQPASRQTQEHRRAIRLYDLLHRLSDERTLDLGGNQGQLRRAQAHALTRPRAGRIFETTMQPSGAEELLRLADEARAARDRLRELAQRAAELRERLAPAESPERPVEPHEPARKLQSVQ